MIWQRTLRNSIHANGTGLHCGETINLKLSPAPANSGIIFRRVDKDPAVVIPAFTKNVGETNLSTTLVSGDTKIATIEHLLSACAGLGIDNLYIDTDGAEVPILDGSSSIFIFMLRSAGVKEQKYEKKFIQVLKEVEVRDGDKFARIRPYNGFKISFTIDFNHPLINPKNNTITVDFSSTTYLRGLSRARTFGFKRDVEHIQANNLALGGSLENVVLLDTDSIVNEHGLRYEDELVKHKVLDAVGDLYLLGHNLLCSYEGHKSGHYLNNQLLRKLQETEGSMQTINTSELDTPPISFMAASGSIDDD